ncbi:uncharacterized protein LOC106157977 isoform X1 [Lingula anatina]|uniref:RING-type E3 ubiquitin transferase n=1 Tax=Lingula anatina TaxID=7574 RepID=A0A1S3HT83_LINAN|nr:uncharacterized protein LOC106157977 isoform X1 [Lingula anatina]XP_013389251.1 uncharacterized protein LOC106157977 isoform X1 [Lingula anatina]XP_013389252.1 uncharacterized protein LOC106157977 isoform X1 [Lingula anatina]XP_013389253.1 uncharacterized protein LOC106157977 isoform X1 [Lingula anatina]XP_013389254.1 uncharacterized protein LOC106157977 isoform X1 [Lingula anatina]XP_013389255.1 uncharacterized protein LOC106157977 isoform X1 [Lingula anatina]|eukprot:XP_013389250.1 uncharacterized protein LOC106157977 isoform X1 [Lingula anatina]
MAEKRCVIVRFPEGIPKEDLRTYFTSYDQHAVVVMTSKTQALITFTTETAVNQVLTQEDHSVNGVNITVQQKPPEPFKCIEGRINSFWTRDLESVRPILEKVANDTGCSVMYKESDIVLRGNFYQVKEGHRKLAEAFANLCLDAKPPSCFTAEDEAEIESFEHVEKHDLQEEFLEKSEEQKSGSRTKITAAITTTAPDERDQKETGHPANALRKSSASEKSGREIPAKKKSDENLARSDKETKAFFEKSRPYEDDLPSPVIRSGKGSPLAASALTRSSSEDENELCVDHHLWLYIRYIAMLILTQIQDKFGVKFLPAFGEEPSYDVVHIEADEKGLPETIPTRRAQAKEEFIQLYQKLSEELLVTSEKVPSTPDICRQVVLDVIEELKLKYVNVAYEYVEETNICFFIGRPFYALQARDEFVKLLKEKLPAELFQNYHRRDPFTLEDILDRGGPRHDETQEEDPIPDDTQNEVQESVHEKHFIQCVQDVKMNDDSVLQILFVTNFSVMVYTGDIVEENVDVIVSASNGFLANAGGVAAAISDAAGRLLDRACARILMERGHPLEVTENEVTTAGDLQAKYVIHAVGPQLRDYPDDVDRLQKLKLTFVNIFRRADELKQTTIALPAIGAGAAGVPLNDVAVALFSAINHVAKRRQSGRYLSLKEIHVLNIDPEATKVVQDIFMQESVTVPAISSKSVKGPVTEIEGAVQKLLERGDARTQEVINELLDETERIGQLEQGRSRRGLMVESVLEEEPGCKTHPRTEEEAILAMEQQRSRPPRHHQPQYGDVEPGCKTHARTEEAAIHALKHQRSPNSPRRHQPTYGGAEPHAKTNPRRDDEMRGSVPQSQPQIIQSPKASRPVKNIGQRCAFCSFDHNLLRLSCNHILCRPCWESIPLDTFGRHPCPFCSGKTSSPKRRTTAPPPTTTTTAREPKNQNTVGQVYDLPGNLRHVTDERQLPGYRGHSTIILHLDVPDGVQKKTHPYPGRPYKGTKIMGYLPDTPEGRQVLSLLYDCFNAGKMFRVIRSKSSGMDRVVSNIPIKTDVYGESGYPDTNYLPQLQERLCSLGLQ